MPDPNPDPNLNLILAWSLNHQTGHTHTHTHTHTFSPWLTLGTYCNINSVRDNVMYSEPFIVVKETPTGRCCVWSLIAGEGDSFTTMTHSNGPLYIATVCTLSRLLHGYLLKKSIFITQKQSARVRYQSCAHSNGLLYIATVCYT